MDPLLVRISPAPWRHDDDGNHGWIMDNDGNYLFESVTEDSEGRLEQDETLRHNDGVLAAAAPTMLALLQRLAQLNEDGARHRRLALIEDTRNFLAHLPDGPHEPAD